MISIVIPLYNKENSIANTIQCILDQTFTDFEIVIVNDGSTDNSANVVDILRKNHPVLNKIDADGRIQFINKTNGGVSSARNIGIETARYDYIAFLDADDRWDAHYLEEHVKLIQNYPKAFMWGVNFAYSVDGNQMGNKSGLQDDFCGYVEKYFDISHSDLFCSSSVVIRKEAFQTVGNFDERIRYSEDLDMWFRIILNYPVVFSSKVLAYYIQDAENRCGVYGTGKTDLKYEYIYYADKYDNTYCKSNSTFGKYWHNNCAAALSTYYFGLKKYRKDARYIASLLDYGDIHPKYKWYYRTPYWIGYSFYKLVNLKKKAQKLINKL